MSARISPPNLEGQHGRIGCSGTPIEPQARGAKVIIVAIAACVIGAALFLYHYTDGFQDFTRLRWALVPSRTKAEEMKGAIEAERLDHVRTQLALGTPVNIRDEEGNTPLHTAAFTGSPRVARLLLQNGADMGARDDDGKTPLDIAKQHVPEYPGRAEVLRVFKEWRAHNESPR